MSRATNLYTFGIPRFNSSINLSARPQRRDPCIFVVVNRLEHLRYRRTIAAQTLCRTRLLTEFAFEDVELWRHGVLRLS